MSKLMFPCMMRCDIESSLYVWMKRESCGIVINGKPNITLFDLHDSYYGPGIREIKSLNDIVKIETDRQKIVKVHNIIDNDLAKYIADSVQRREKFNKIYMNILDKMNKKEREMKTKEKVTKVFELTQKELIAAIKDYLSKRVKLSGAVTIHCETENGGRMNLLPMNQDDGEEIITCVEVSDIESTKPAILKTDEQKMSPVP